MMAVSSSAAERMRNFATPSAEGRVLVKTERGEMQGKKGERQGAGRGG